MKLNFFKFVLPREHSNRSFEHKTNHTFALAKGRSQNLSLPWSSIEKKTYQLEKYVISKNRKIDYNCIYIVNFRKLKFRLFENLQCKCSYNRFSDFPKSLYFQVDRFSFRCCSKASIDFSFYPSPEQKYGLSCVKTSD